MTIANTGRRHAQLDREQDPIVVDAFGDIGHGARDSYGGSRYGRPRGGNLSRYCDDRGFRSERIAADSECDAKRLRGAAAFSGVEPVGRPCQLFRQPPALRIRRQKISQSQTRAEEL